MEWSEEGDTETVRKREPSIPRQRQDAVRFIDLFAGLGGFHVALESLGHECVFASEIDPELGKLYRDNHAGDFRLVGDIRKSRSEVPSHDILCAGFPCQPFSKSGEQEGFDDVTRGTLFHEILAITRRHQPTYVLLENVGNFARHDGGRTWEIVRESLEAIGYCVRGTLPKVAGGHGLISPHHFGHPHHRERFFAIATSHEQPSDPFPGTSIGAQLDLDKVLLRELSAKEAKESALSARQIEYIDAWNEFVEAVPPRTALPSFPIWVDEFNADYPFENGTPHSAPVAELAAKLGVSDDGDLTFDELAEHLPPYARNTNGSFPKWKQRFIRQNREWFAEIEDSISQDWLATVRGFPPSLRKLEWNCKGEERNLWSHILQFRPSGLRVKRFKTIPALVAMTTTQIPILGPRRRHLARREGLRLQGFPDDFLLPNRTPAAFSALGNAVHVDVVRRIVQEMLAPASSDEKTVGLGELV